MAESRGCFGWMEIGRATPDGGAPWTVWMALLPEGGALYRTLIVADDALTVTVDLQPHHGAGMRTLHKGRRYLSSKVDGDALANALLTIADESARATLARSNGLHSIRSGVAALAEAAADHCRFSPQLQEA